MRLSTTQITSAGVRELLMRQADVQKTQLQLASQKRVITPSDDPVAATSISYLQAEIAQLQQFNLNGNFAKSNNELEETVLDSTTQVLFRVKELLVSLGNGAYGVDEFNAIKIELEERLKELQGLANTQNSNGDYIFSGSKVKAQPILQDSAGNFIYNGDQDQRMLRISSGVVIPISDSGFEIFVDVKNGNGKFITSSNPVNAGNGVIAGGSYQGPPQFMAEPYSIDFALNLAGDLEYTVTGVTSGTVVAGPTVYQDPSDIEFNGVQVRISGTPETGDSFTVTPSQSQDLFTTIQNILDAIDNYDDSSAGRAQLTNIVGAQQNTLDKHMINIDMVRSRIGSRLNVGDSEYATNLSLLVTSRTALSDVQDLDMVEASTRFSQQLVVLEAAQASFVRVQGLNLFNFLR